jgi:hypothetical protein
MYKKLFFFVFFSLLFLTVAKNNIYAQEQSLSIYPPVIEVQTTPPSSPTVPLIIQSNIEDDVTLKIQLVPFKTNNITGEIKLLPNEITKGFYPYYRDRIQFLLDGKKTDTITLAPLEAKQLELNINLEKGDPPGDFYYSVVFMSSLEGPNDTSVSQMPVGIATNLLLSVGPKDPSSGSISQFNTGSFKASGPVDFTLKIHNSSKHLINPTGSIRIKNLFGQEVGIVKILPQYILAGSDRFLLDDKQSSPEASLAYAQLNSTPKLIWPDKFLLGWYEAKATVLLEEDGQKLTQTLYFFAFPLYLFFPLVVIIFVILSIYLKVKKKI